MHKKDMPLTDRQTDMRITVTLSREPIHVHIIILRDVLDNSSQNESDTPNNPINEQG